MRQECMKWSTKQKTSVQGDDLCKRDKTVETYINRYKKHYEYCSDPVIIQCPTDYVHLSHKHKHRHTQHSPTTLLYIVTVLAS